MLPIELVRVRGIYLSVPFLPALSSCVVGPEERFQEALKTLVRHKPAKSHVATKRGRRIAADELLLGLWTISVEEPLEKDGGLASP